MYCKGVVPDGCKEKKKKIFVFFVARFIVSEWLMTRNYPDIITYVFFVKSGSLQAWVKSRLDHPHHHCC